MFPRTPLFATIPSGWQFQPVDTRDKDGTLTSEQYLARKYGPW